MKNQIVNLMTRTATALMVLVLVSVSASALAGTSEGCHIAGPDNAPIVIQEFADFHCKYCVKGSKRMSEVMRNYPDKVKLVYRNMPLPFHGSSAMTAAKAFTAVCLQSSTLGYAYQKELFDNQDRLMNQGDQFLFDLADKIGVNVTQMKTDMEGDIVAKIIAADQALAKSYNLSGTPSFLIGSETITGAQPYDEFKKVIEKQLGH